jgi:hypothetical protein
MLFSRQKLEPFTGEWTDGVLNLQTELMLAMMHQQGDLDAVNDLSIVETTDGLYLQNAKHHEPLKNKYNFKLTLEPKIAPFITHANNSKDSYLFKEELSIPTKIPSNLRDLHRLSVINAALSIVECRIALMSLSSHNTYMNHKRIENGGYLELHITSGYVKPLDNVVIKHKDKSVTLLTVRKVMSGAAFVDLVPTENTFVLVTSRTSVASEIKNILSFEKASLNGSNLSQLLRNALCVNGYGGTGKSFHIVKNFSKKTINSHCNLYR